MKLKDIKEGKRIIDDKKENKKIKNVKYINIRNFNKNNPIIILFIGLILLFLFINLSKEDENAIITINKKGSQRLINMDYINYYSNKELYINDIEEFPFDENKSVIFN